MFAILLLPNNDNKAQNEFKQCINPRKCIGYFMFSEGELFDWSNLLHLTLLGVVCMNISWFGYVNIRDYQKWNIMVW